MSALRVRYSRQAFRHIEVASDWWKRNRPSAPGLLRDEFATAIRILREFPDVGVPYRHRRICGIRRYVLINCGYILFYVHLQSSQEVIVLALWQAERGRNPPLRKP